MSNISKNLSTVVATISQQAASIDANLKVAEEAILNLDEESQAAINHLIARYEDVQMIGNIIGAQLSIRKLRAAKEEVAVVIATMKAALNNAKFEGEIQQQLTADLLRDKSAND